MCGLDPMRKIPVLALSVSLALNLALAWLLLAGANRPAPDDAVVPALLPPIRPPALDAALWPSLHTTDLPDLISRLRAAGFPPYLVRAVVAAQMDESFAARRLALDSGTDSLPFWKTRAPDARANLALLQFEREKQAALRQLLGPDPEADGPLGQISQNRRLQGLPPDKVEAVRNLLRGFDEQRDDIYAAGTYSIDREKIKALDKAQHDAIARLLKPQELVEYDLRTSETAGALRDKLSAFSPTEAEFRAIYRLTQPFNEQFGNDGGPPSSDQMRRRDEAEILLTEQIKSVLTPDRAVEFEHAIDSGYRQTSQLVARLELPPEITGQVYAVQKDAQQRLSACYRDQTLSLEQRTQQLAALRQEVEAKLTPMLGAQGLEAYRQYGGSWMRNLTLQVPQRR